MSDPITTGAGSVGPGMIRFYDAIQPPLTAGDYTLLAEQQVLDIKGEDVPAFSATKAFRVDGPRFQIDPTTIHTVFPPANQSGAYFDVLPHIVFKDFSLPWARNVDPNAGIDDAASPPWMALLTLYDTELTPPVGQPTLVSPPVTVPVAQILQPSPADPRLLSPCLPAGAVASTTDNAQVVDMDLAFFQGIAPTLGELDFLAHARAVNTGGKVLLGMDDDGSFSVVVGNRVAKNGARNTVLLVSLEGHQAHLRGGAAITSCDGTTPAQPYNRVRLVVLGAWSFTALEMPGSFLALMQRLPSRGGVGLLQLPLRSDLPANALVQEAIRIGYVPLQNDLRVGEKTTSWYRGPLVADPTQRDQTDGPYTFSDHAMHYDPNTGFFNHAYAAAWQIGRLLALSDGHFAQSLFDWRRSYFQQVQRDADAQMVDGRVAASLAVGPGIQAADPGTGVPQQMRSFLLAALPGMPDLPRVQPRGRGAAVSSLPGILSTNEVDDILAAGDDPLLALRNLMNPQATP
jgi:hypothetical protein